MHTKSSRKSGFSVLEIILVLVTIVLVALFTIPHFVKPKSSPKGSCFANLRQIAAAKQQWAEETKQAPTVVPADSDLFGPTLYLREKHPCPRGGTYKLNAVSAKPTCSKSGAPDFHTL